MATLTGKAECHTQVRHTRMGTGTHRRPYPESPCSHGIEWLKKKWFCIETLKCISVLWDHSTWIGESAGFLVIGHPIKVQIKRVIAIAGFCYFLGQTNPLTLLKFAEAITLSNHWRMYIVYRKSIFYKSRQTTEENNRAKILTFSLFSLPKLKYLVWCNK